jgi:hypothetical protein
MAGIEWMVGAQAGASGGRENQKHGRIQVV